MVFLRVVRPTVVLIFLSTAQRFCYLRYLVHCVLHNVRVNFLIGKCIIV